MAKFDMAAVIAGQGVSKLDTSDAPKIEMIDIDQIDANEANFYAVSELQALANSIAIDGVQQPLIVITSPEDDARVKLISGHRRRAAVKLLVSDPDEPRPDLRRVPCIRKVYKSPAMAELQLIMANSTARTISSADLMVQSKRLEELFYQLKEEGYQFPGKMRDQVAAACKASASKLARLKVIRERLAPEYMEQFKGEKLSEQAAYALAGLPQDLQTRCAKAVKGTPNGYDAEGILRKVKEGCTYLPDFSCPDGTPCRHGDAFLRHDFKSGYYSMCGGETCCLNCRQAFESYCACDSACSKVKAERSRKADDRKKAQKRQVDEQLEAARRELEKATVYLERMKQAAEAGGLKLDDKALNKIFGYHADHVDRILSGKYEPYQYENPLGFLPRMDDLADFCREAGCSADELLGLSGRS